jgi:hypothetical protein
MNPAGAPVSGAGYGVGYASTELQVTQNGTPNMSVNVAAGHAWIDGTESAVQGAYHGYNDATKNLVVAASDPTNPRKDLVVAKVQDAAYSGAVNAWSLVVVTGTPAASPAEPAVPANGVVLALIDVAALATTVTTANITDRRRRASALGGIVVCSSATRPAAPYEGLFIWETDTQKIQVYTGGAFVEMEPAGPWTSYTPALTNVTLGNGAITGRWCRRARMITAEMQFTLGSTSAVGGGGAGLGLPVAAAAASRAVGSCHYLDTGVRNHVGTGRVNDTGASTLTLYHAEAISTGNVTTTGPFTWGTGDQIFASVMYESAA